MFPDSKYFWEVGTIKKKVGNMINIIKGPQFTHTKHLNQIRKHLSNDTDSGLPEENEESDIMYDTFDMLIPQTAPVQRRLKRKMKMTDFIVVNPKRKRY